MLDPSPVLHMYYYSSRLMSSIFSSSGPQKILQIKKVNKMSEWVAVCADESEEPVEIPTETDGELVSVVTSSSVNFVRCDIFVLKN